MDNDQNNDLEQRIDNFKKLSGDQLNRERHGIMGRFGRMSIDLISGVGLGAFMGYQIDKYIGSLPLFFIVLTVLGAVAGFWNFYKDLLKEMKKERKDNE